MAIFFDPGPKSPPVPASTMSPDVIASRMALLAEVSVPSEVVVLIERMDELLARSKTLFQEDFYIAASKLLERIEKAIATALNDTCTEVQRSSLISTQARINSDEFKYIRAIRHELQIILDSTSKLDGWTEAGESKGIRTYYRAVAGTSTHSFYTVGDVEAPLFDILPCFYEVDLMKTWLPALSATNKLATCLGSRFRMIAQLQVPLIFPIASRECVLYGYGDVFEDGVAIFFRSTQPSDTFIAEVDSPPSTSSSSSSGPAVSSSPPPTLTSARGVPVVLPDVPSGFVRATLHFGGFLIKPKGPSTCEVKTVFNLDPALAVVPYWLLNYISQKFCYILLSYLRSTAQKMGSDRRSEFGRRIAANKNNVYGELRWRAGLYAATKAAERKS